MPGVKRAWRSATQPTAAGAPWGGAQPPPAVEAEAELVALDLPPERYAARPVRPIVQLAARVGLWTAVGFGCLGGVLGMVRPPTQDVRAIVEQSGEDATLPAPVAGTAELIVQEWLTATDGDAERLDHLFIRPPSLVSATSGDLSVSRVVTVAGERRDEGYWAVTVAADVTETVAVDPDTGEAETAESVWYVELAIVGDVAGGLAALTTPAVVPAPPEARTGWRPSTRRPTTAGDEPLATTVEGFLGALLAGGGDPSRYLAPGREVAAISPAPFETVELLEMAVDDLGDGELRALATVAATTPGGTSTHLGYELVLVERSDRWEVTRFAGAPTILVAPPDGEGDGDGDAELAPGSGDGTTGGDEGGDDPGGDTGDETRGGGDTGDSGPSGTGGSGPSGAPTVDEGVTTADGGP